MGGNFGSRDVSIVVFKYNAIVCGGCLTIIVENMASIERDMERILCHKCLTTKWGYGEMGSLDNGIVASGVRVPVSPLERCMNGNGISKPPRGYWGFK